MWNRQFISLCLILLASELVIAPIQLLFPVYVEDALKKTVWDTVLFRSLPIALGGLFSLVGGALSDRLGRKPTLIVGMTGALVIGCVLISKQPLLIFVILCYHGVASGFRAAGGQSYLISVVNADRLGFAAAVYFNTYTFGGAVGNAIGGKLVMGLGYWSVGLGAIFIMILLILAALVLLPHLPGSQKSTECESFAQMLAGYRKILRRREMRLLLCMRFLPTYYWGTASLLLPVLIKRATSIEMVGYYGALRDLFAASCQLLSGRICDAVGTRVIAFVATCLVAISAGLIALYANSIVILYAAGVFGAGAAWSISITMPRFIDEFSTTEEKGRGVGITHLAWSSGFLSGHVVGGGLESVHVSLPFAVACGLVALSALLAFRLWRSQEREVY